MWTTFGVPAHQWAELDVEDLQWMTAAIDRQQQKDQQEARRSKG